MVGAMLAGWQNIIGCEIDPDYIEIALARLHHWKPEQMTLW
jgi:DNA modification methylase